MEKETPTATPEKKQAAIDLADKSAKKNRTQYFVIFHNFSTYEVVGQSYFQKNPDDKQYIVHTTEDHTDPDQLPRADYLAKCKAAAILLLDAGKFGKAWEGFYNDMKKHPHTALHPALNSGQVMFQSGTFKSTNDMRKYIEGFK